MTGTGPGTPTVRPPAVAGLFYPDQPEALRQQVQSVLAAEPDLAGTPPKAVIAPHAAYRYSGVTAGYAYDALAGHRGSARRVVVVGPAHRVAFDGVGLSSAGSWATPLGEARLDREAMARLIRQPGVTVADRAHEPEHSIEVHLPFIREVLGDVDVVPLVVGRATTRLVAQCLLALWGDEETVIVASSDLSHYLDEAAAWERDDRTVDAILEGRYRAIGPQDACGWLPVGGLLRAATARGLAPALLHRSTSAEASGDTGRVVGYGSFGVGPPGKVGAAAGAWLAQLAVDVLDGVDDRGDVPAASRRPGASFVSLRRDGELLGCIGSLEPQRPLWRDVAFNAWSAAFDDPRFASLGPQDLAGVEVKVSVLSPLEEVLDASPGRLCDLLRPGTDGLAIAARDGRATFLPDVWSKLPEPEGFLAELVRKAGWEDGWVTGSRAWRYTTETFTARL